MKRAIETWFAGDHAAGRLTPRHWLTLAVVLLAALLPGLATIPVMDRDEARYSQAAVQMMETGDYVDIRFQDQPRHVKPAGIYWMQVAAAAPFGGPDAPMFFFRLPSLIGILLACGVTAWFGARLVSPATGVAAGALLGLTILTAIEARTAKTDAMLLASAVAAQVALFYLLTPPRGSPRPSFWGAPAIFWAATGAAIMIKGPIVTLVSASTIAAYGIWVRDPGVLRRIRPLWGLLLTAAITLPWLIAINIQTDGAFLEESIGHALLGKVAESDDSHAGPLGYHTLLLPAMFWPGTVLLGLGGIAAWQRRHETTYKFLIAWIVPTWIIFELIQTKLPHYVYPAYPAIALLAAIGLKDAGQLLTSKWPKRVHIASTVLFGLASLIVIALPFVGASELDMPAVRPAHVVAAIFAVAALGAGIWLALSPDRIRLAALLFASIGVYWAIFEGTIPRLDRLWPSARVAAIVDDLTGCDRIDAVTLGYREPSNVRYLGTGTVLADTADQAITAVARGPECAVAIVDAADRAAFDAIAAERGLTFESVGRVEGINAVKGRDLDLDILLPDGTQLTR